MRGVVTGNFGKLRGGKGARGVRCSKDNFGRVGKEKARNFVNGFVAKSSVDKPDLAAGDVLLEEKGEFAGGAGIVRTVDIDVRRGLQFFEGAGPDGGGDAAGDGLIRNLKAAILEKPCGGEGVQGVLELEAAAEARGE